MLKLPNLAPDHARLFEICVWRAHRPAPSPAGLWPSVYSIDSAIAMVASRPSALSIR